MTHKYIFTGDELTRLLSDAISLAFESYNRHDKLQGEATNAAIAEIFQSFEIRPTPRALDGRVRRGKKAKVNNPPASNA